MRRRVQQLPRVVGWTKALHHRQAPAVRRQQIRAKRMASSLTLAFTLAILTCDLLNRVLREEFVGIYSSHRLTFSPEQQ
jgi:hypothetical protein